MSVRVQLDSRQGSTYTNLDYVTGRVILTLPTDAAVSAITVKLEGESKTRLAGPKSPNDQERKKTLLEVHKLLYKVQRVFPGPELGPSQSAQFTLQRGQYEYPFQFKIPFNNDCTNNSSLVKDLKLGQMIVSVGEEPQHVKLTLPPTLAGYPGEADIKYYVKATVVRPKFYQENLRSTIDLLFLPIEPPRPPERNEETYARRKHQFSAYGGQAIKRKSIFRKDSKEPTGDQEPLLLACDARLPNPPIITCREPLPLRLLVEKLNGSSANVYMTTLQIELIGRTTIRAYDLTRVENSNYVIFSQANMSVQLRPPQEKEKHWFIPSHFWDKIPLPNVIPPSFKTCNISRAYELEVRVGLSHGGADGMRPEIIIFPLRLDVQVYSGIRPPPQLLSAMAEQAQRQNNQIFANNNIPNTYPVNTDGQFVPAHRPSIPESSPIQANPNPSPLAQPQSQPHPPISSADDAPPPSYEDAIAEEIAPVDGPRRDYAPTSAPPSTFNSDIVSSPSSSSSTNPSQPWVPDQKSAAGVANFGRRVSERLFSQNAPRSPGFGSNRTARNGSVGISEGLENTHLGSDEREEGEDEAEYRPALPVRRTSSQTQTQTQGQMQGQEAVASASQAQSSSEKR